MAKHNELGKLGELMALKMLRDKGYEILDQNWRSGKNEIDIIAQRSDVVVFVEVKTRKTDFFGAPSETLSKQQEKRIISAANDYLQQNQITVEARFDLIGIVKNNKEEKLEHIIDAFFPFV